MCIWGICPNTFESDCTYFLIIGAEKEVVSIYNNDFTTPKSRVPYFIQVYRCVKADYNCGSTEYPVPLKKEEIEIVVPDLTSSYREDPKVFYKYVVYSHISCKCGTSEERKNSTEIRNETGNQETHMPSFIAFSYH